MLKDLLDSNGFVAIVTSLFGGAGLAIVSKLLNKGDTKTTQQTQFREEQRLEIESLRSQVKGLNENETNIEKEVDVWREKYYNLLVEGQKATSELSAEVERLKQETVMLKNIIGPK